MTATITSFRPPQTLVYHHQTAATYRPRSILPDHQDAEPESKRRRVTPPAAGAGQGFKSLSQCCDSYVSPLVDQKAENLSTRTLRVKALKAAVVHSVVIHPLFKAEYGRTFGLLSPQYQQVLAGQIEEEIKKLCKLPEYRIDIEPEPEPELASAKIIPSVRPQTPVISTPARDQPLPSIENTRYIKAGHPATKRPKSAGRKAPKANVSPLKYRAQERSFAFKYQPATRPSQTSTEGRKKRPYLSSQTLPYLTGRDREQILRGSSKLLRLPASQHQDPASTPYHVDFDEAETIALRKHMWHIFRQPGTSKEQQHQAWEAFWVQWKQEVGVITPQICRKPGLERRDEAAVGNFIQDVAERKTSKVPVALRLEFQAVDRQNEAGLLQSLLLAREVEGNRGFGKMQRLVNFTNEFRKLREDNLELQAEWTNCAGDIATISWVSDHGFLCGTTAHSDAHNQQYNKPGNLLLCSPSRGSLKAYPDHRIVRPLVDKGENSTEAMRETQDPWLYCSVVSSDYDALHDRAFTSSFDKTVKIWQVDKQGFHMGMLGSWSHDGHVNFVAASRCRSDGRSASPSLVATAADVPSEAVRVYHVNENNPSQSPFMSFSSSRTWDEDDKDTQEPQKWAYFPATMQWGVHKDVQHLLLVGYSPRSITGNEDDIPVAKQQSGEICLWDCITGQKCRVTTASTQNVFEVAWHPTQPSFIVATSPSGLHVEENVRTQIRIFRPSDSLDPEQRGGFSEFQCLDCPAADINELTIKPCSMRHSYITAAATDGNVYVWDTARGDDPLHILSHGEPIEEPFGELYDRERDDTGVKFTAWGTSQDRFYTGGSDGVVKVWNVRNLHDPLIRNLLEVPAPVSSGAFCPDKSKLAIGDASGRVFLLSVDEADEPPASFVQLPAGVGPLAARSIRRPRAYQPHPTPPPPEGAQSDDTTTGIVRARRYLSEKQLRVVPHPCVGAVQGEAYSSLGLYRNEFHMGDDPAQPLLASVEREQRENAMMYSQCKMPTLFDLPPPLPSIQAQHRRNLARDPLNLRSLPATTQMELQMARINLDDVVEDVAWDYEEDATEIDPDWDEE